MTTAISWKTDAQVVRERLSANWTTTRIAWDNVRFAPTPDTPWVRCEVVPVDAQIADTGAATHRYRHMGLVVVSVFVPEGDGEALAWQYADSIAAIFRGVRDGTVMFRAPRPVRLGVQEGWYRVDVQVPYERDTVF